MIITGVVSANLRPDDRSLTYVFAWCSRNYCETVEINTMGACIQGMAYHIAPVDTRMSSPLMARASCLRRYKPSRRSLRRADDKKSRQQLPLGALWPAGLTGDAPEMKLLNGHNDSCTQSQEIQI